MIYFSLLLITLLFSFNCFAQRDSVVITGSDVEQQLENLAEQQNGEPEDDSFLQTLSELRKNKLNLNAAEENDLKELRFLSPLQTQNFAKYRKLLGKFISIYELQSIPGWDVPTIRKILPYVQVGNAVPFGADLKERLIAGEHSMLVRMQRVVEKSNGFLRPDSATIRYPGSPERIFFRYKYTFGNLLQFGLTADKDAGEQFFGGNQKRGFDFYSFHFFARKLGPVKAVALGDYTVNLGQGLIHWQSLAFKKSAAVTAVKRESDVLRPYSSSGEYNFMRGAGITVGLKNFAITAFGSERQLDGSLDTDTSSDNTDYVSTILNSGYHRTATEVGKRNAITQTSAGGNISFTKNNFHFGVNGIAVRFSTPIKRNIQPYNQFAINGNGWFNYSLDYSYTYRNFHFFGEAASDKNRFKAFLGGLLASLDEKVDVSLVYRSIDNGYQTLYGNAFTENTFPTNEKGLFMGISLKPMPSFKIDAYADLFSFPWLKYRVDAPTSGSEYLLQLSYRPNKQVEMYTRLKIENKARNLSSASLALREVTVMPKESWRTHWSYKVSKQFTFSQRVEVTRFDRLNKDRSQQGFLIYTDGRYKPFNKPFSINARCQYFETDGFDSRIYAFESDVLYSYSIPQFLGKGFRYYLNINYDVSRKMTAWFRVGQTVYADQKSISSGLDKIEGNKKTEVKVQALYTF